MLKLLAVVVVVATAVADLDADWAVFKAKYNKKYNPEMENLRKYIWIENKRIIEEHNKKFELGLSSYYLGENEYADKTTSEFVSRMNGLKLKQEKVAERDPHVKATALQDSVDWRTKGYVTPVKNQLDCNCGWAFAATGSMEGFVFKTQNKLVNLSESNLVDCSEPYGNHGCLDGTVRNAFFYVFNNGIETESTYPYTPKENTCKATQNNTFFHMLGWEHMGGQCESVLQYQVAEVGPISAVIDASLQSFKLYKGGVYNDPKCTEKNLNHGVLVVGYGTNQSDDYWIVKNSWGTSWGEQGYIRMSRNKDNQCGIASLLTFPCP